MVKIFSVDGKESGDINLPEVFNTKFNYVTFKKAYLAEESEKFQLKYTDPMAGKRKVAELTKRRRSFKTSYGRGLDRTPRKTLSRVGTNFSYMGAVAPNTVGGRQAHPPKAERKLVKEINKKERKLAIKMGIAASADIKQVSEFHAINGIKGLPIVVDDSAIAVKKTKDAIKLFSSLGLDPELKRIMHKSIRSGKGKLRGRKYKKKLAMVLVVKDGENPPAAFSNINIKVTNPSSLSMSDVSQAGRPGRLMIWTKGAIENLR
jgi:large subunit ribosomal protein L4e